MYFCPKCGVRTRKGEEAKIPLPYEDWKEMFSEMGKEIERAFSIAAKKWIKPSKRLEMKLEKQPVKSLYSVQVAEKGILLILDSATNVAKNFRIQDCN